MLGYYDKNGDELTLEDYAYLSNIEGYKRVASYKFRDGTLVSTVWLGINHAFDDGPPVIFETMVFGGDDVDDFFDEWTDRYPTLEDARLGHAIVVEMVREHLEQRERQKQQVREQN